MKNKDDLLEMLDEAENQLAEGLNGVLQILRELEKVMPSNMKYKFKNPHCLGALSMLIGAGNGFEPVDSTYAASVEDLRAFIEDTIPDEEDEDFEE